MHGHRLDAHDIAILRAALRRAISCKDGHWRDPVTWRQIHDKRLRALHDAGLIAISPGGLFASITDVSRILLATLDDPPAVPPTPAAKARVSA